MPAYVIFHDSTLNEIAIRKPKTDYELLEIQGMGQVKFQRFGKDILKLINDLNAQEFAPKLTTHQQTLLYY